MKARVTTVRMKQLNFRTFVHIDAKLSYTHMFEGSRVVWVWWHFCRMISMLVRLI